MTDSADESLSDLVAKWQERVRKLRRAGETAALIAGANAAAGEIEQRAGEGTNDAQRRALNAARRFTYNAAADCWPGWSVPDRWPDKEILVAAQNLATRSACLVRKLNLGPLQEGTGTWLCGAFDLALGRYPDAANAFALARQCYVAANAPGLVLLMEGYIAIVRQMAGDRIRDAEVSLEQTIAAITAGAFEDGPEWAEQLRTAREIFAR